MATITLTSLTFNAVPSGNQLVHLKWRLTSDPDIPGSYTDIPDATVNTSGTIISPSPYTFTVPDDSITLVATNDCSTNEFSKDFPISITYKIDTYTCEQDSVFTPIATITGLSSPRFLYYDDVTGRVYGVDGDNVNGPFFWYLPTATLSSQINYTQSIIAGGGQKYYYASDLDPQYRRSYVTGRDTGGMNVYDWDTDAVTVVPFGSDGANFNRQFVKVFTNVILCTDTVAATLTIIDRATLSVISTTAFSAIPSGTSSLYGSPTIEQVGSEIWVARNNSSAGVQSPNIFCYNDTFTTLIRTINVSADSAVVASANVYCKAAWVYNGIYYVLDAGSSKLMRIDPATPTTYTVVHTFNNRGNQYNYTAAALVVDPISGDTFLNTTYYVALGNSSSRSVVFKWDFANDRPTYIYPDTSFLNLTRIGISNQLHGASPGNAVWNIPNTGWDTDGVITKYTR